MTEHVDALREHETSGTRSGTRVDAVSLYSGGVTSFFATLRYLEQHPDDEVVLLFTDTNTEDADLYRFVEETVVHLRSRYRVRLVTLNEGRDIWQVFKDGRMLGNTRADLCSRVLKREPAAKWIAENAAPDTPLIFGYDWTELHRHERTAARWSPRPVISPLTESPYLLKAELFTLLELKGIKVPRLYRYGLAHNNCGGGCVKAGQGHFAHLLKVLPDVYADWERNEQGMRDLLGDVSILRDRESGETTPLTLRELRERIEAGQPCDLWDVGGCGCFAG